VNNQKRLDKENPWPDKTDRNCTNGIRATHHFNSQAAQKPMIGKDEISLFLSKISYYYRTSVL
jgi:hypothetical protein